MKRKCATSDLLWRRPKPRINEFNRTQKNISEKISLKKEILHIEKNINEITINVKVNRNSDRL